jgi:DNA polymerase III sliding clamp (beta) subunit (PCNA family)
MSKYANGLIRTGVDLGVQQLQGLNPANKLSELITLCTETWITVEKEETKRTQIVAEKETKIEMIRAQRDFFMEYLKKTFDERATNFNKLFEVIDNALENDNIQQLALGLDSLNKLAAESPFKVIADINALGEALDNKMEFDF